MITLTIDDVIAIHDIILDTEPGREGYHGDNALGGALGRIDNQVMYAGINDIFDVAAMYVEAIAMGHCFADANKRTSLVSAITYLGLHDVVIKEEEGLADIVVDLVNRQITRDDVAIVFKSLVE
jgi:death-on-curing protein